MADLQAKVKEWWNSNPYSYGMTSNDSYKDVGALTNQELTLALFDEYMRKVRKHFDDAQGAGERIASRFIDYEDLSGKHVLDIASGYGWATVEMCRAGANVTGIDVAPRAIEGAKKHLEFRGLQADMRVMDAQAMDFPNSTFDFVLAWGCLMHMPDTEKAISEIFRVLKPGGRVAGYMYNKHSISFWWNIWFVRGIMLGRLFAYKGSTTALVSRYTDGYVIGGNAHTKVYSPREAERLFEQKGFRTVQFRPWGPPSMISGFPFTKVPLGRLLPYPIRKAIADRFGWGMVFRAQKPD